MSLRIRSIAAAGLLLASHCHAAGAAGPDDSPEDRVRRTLEQRYPQVKVLQVSPSPVAGLYEVFTGDAIAYADARGAYLIVGQMMDTDSKRNLSATRLDELNRIDLARLPLAKSFTYVRGAGSRHLYVFSDPDCPYCQQLEKDLATLDDVTVHILLYPLASIHPEAVARARAIWCAPDRAAAWSGWMLDRRDPGTADCTTHPVDDLVKLGRELRVISTPTLVFEDGRRFSGAPPRERLVEMLDAARAAAPAARD